MNLNLSDSGTELKANAKDIQQIIDEALKKCSTEVDKMSVNDSNINQLD